jgi:hypothetical protein
MNSEARRAERQFIDDVREARDVEEILSDYLELSLLSDSGSPYTVTYIYDPTREMVTRQVGGVSSNLLTGVESFSLSYYNLQNRTTDKLREVRKIQMRGVIKRGEGDQRENRMEISVPVLFLNRSVTN